MRRSEQQTPKLRNGVERAFSFVPYEAILLLFQNTCSVGKTNVESSIKLLNPLAHVSALRELTQCNVKI